MPELGFFEGAHGKNDLTGTIRLSSINKEMRGGACECTVYHVLSQRVAAIISLNMLYDTKKTILTPLLITL